MRSRIRVLGHPMHPILVMFPTAMLPLLLALDALHGWLGDEGTWTAGFWVASFGLLTTLAAIVPGIIDFAAIPNESRAHRTALFHFIVGMTVLATYAAAMWVRWPAGSDDARFTLAATVDVVGVLLVTLQGWLGAELVYKHHIGVRTLAEGADPVTLEGGSEPSRPDKSFRRPS